MNNSYLSIMASHRKNKNTDAAVDKYILSLGQNVSVEKIYLLDYSFSRCLSCGYCKKNYGKCFIHDDMTILYEKLANSENIIFASPVYFNCVSTLAKIFIDRCQMIYHCNYSHKKPFVIRKNQGKGIIISNGGAPYYKNQFIGSNLTISAFFAEIGIHTTEHIKYSHTDRYPLF